MQEVRVDDIMGTFAKTNLSLRILVSLGYLFSQQRVSFREQFREEE